MGEQVGAGLKKEALSAIRVQKKICVLMTDKPSVSKMYLENCIYEKFQKENVKRLEIGKKTSEELSLRR